MSAFEGSPERLEQILQNPQGDLSEEDCELIQRFAGKVFEGIADVKKIDGVIERLDNIDSKIDKEVDRGQSGFDEVRRAHKGLSERIDKHEQSIERRMANFDQRLKNSEDMMAYMKLSLDANSQGQKQQFELTKTVLDRVDAISSIVTVAPDKKQAPKISALPWQAWLAIALVIIAALSMATGQFDTFMSAFDKSKVEAKK